MTLPPLTLALLLLVPALCGVCAMRLLGFGWRGDRLSYAGHAWMLGALVAALVTFGWHAAGKPFDGRLLAPLLGLAAAAGLFALRRRAVFAPAPPPAPRWERIVLTGMVAVLAVAIFARLFALNVLPVLYGDEANIFAQKAKAMFTARVLDEEYMIRQAQWGVAHIDYPVFDPMLHAWVYAGAGRITLVDNRWPVQMFAFALLLALAGALRWRLRPSAAAVALVAFFGMRIFDLNIGPSRAELILLTGILVAADGWLRWSDDRRDAWWRLACCGVAVALWAKNEGALMIVALLCALALARLVRAVPALLPAVRREQAWLLVPAGVLGLHVGFNAYLGVRNDLFDPEVTGETFWQRAFDNFGPRAAWVLDYYWNELILDWRWFALLIPALLGFAVAAGRATVRTSILVPVATVAVALAGYHVVFLATPHELSWHMPTAADRTVLHVMPVAMLGLAMAAARSAPLVAASPRV